MDAKNNTPSDMTKERPRYCCKKMYEVLRYKESNFHAAKPDLISIYAGNTEIVTTKEIQAAIKVLDEKLNKEIKSKKVIIVHELNDKEIEKKVVKHNMADKVTKIQMTEIISFCPFCGKKLNTK